METKHLSAFMKEKRVSMKFANGLMVDAMNLARGLSFWWTAWLDVTVICLGFKFIHVKVNFKISFLCTFVHALIDANERWAFRHTISSLKSDPNVGCLLVGDFNAVLYDYEKDGRILIRYFSATDFKNFIFDVGLVDLGFTVDQFTWTNKEKGRNEFKERLDRALCNFMWRDDYEDAMVIHGIGWVLTIALSI
ncbi:hypothetical protein LINGRAHAP2_LOCUS32066 [Linum grandiflorum]